MSGVEMGGRGGEGVEGSMDEWDGDRREGRGWRGAGMSGMEMGGREGSGGGQKGWRGNMDEWDGDGREEKLGRRGLGEHGGVRWRWREGRGLRGNMEE